MCEAQQLTNTIEAWERWREDYELNGVIEHKGKNKDTITFPFPGYRQSTVKPF
jgi:hypothetical protein